jgi:UDPglucose--hexose-1-phosphate uridylyltransferase
MEANETPQKKPEVRVDPLNGLRVIVAGGRASRPGGLRAPEPPPPIDPEKDPFAEGKESMTPLEVWADRPGGGEPNTPGWRVRSVPNLYPALAQEWAGVTPDGAEDPLAIPRGMPQLLSSSPAYGEHEVIVNSPDPVQSLGELSREQLDAALAGWATRIGFHTARPEVAYAHLCVNEGIAAGASLPHTHAQLYVLPWVPALIARERERTRAYFEHTQGRSLAEDVLAEEVRGAERIIAIDDDAVLISPYAAATPYRLYVVPRRPEARFEDSESRGVGMLFTAFAALREALGGNPPLNLWVRTAPRGVDTFGWRIEIAPRLGQPAGFELGTGVNINVVPPEDAARNLREALG